MMQGNKRIVPHHEITRSLRMAAGLILALSVALTAFGKECEVLYPGKTSDYFAETPVPSEQYIAKDDSTKKNVYIMKVAKTPEAFAQDEIVEFVTVDQMPLFRCSNDQTLLLQYIASNINYPSSAKEAGKSGVSYISFVVSVAGKVTNAEVRRGFDAACDAEALRVINSLPDFCPGAQSGVPVPVNLTIPVRFELK